MSITEVIFLAALLLLASIVASKMSSRFGVPSLILFVGVGMLAGSDGLLGIKFDNAAIAQFIGIFALNFILFAGGMDTKKSDIYPVIKPGAMLSIFGTTITAILVGCFTYLINPENFSLLEAMLLGAIVSSTDAAAIFSIFSMKGVNLRHRINNILELESGSNDPIAYFLTVTIIYLIGNPTESVTSMIPIFLLGMGVGSVIGIVMGYLTVFIIRKINLMSQGLYPILVIALTMLTYSCSELLHGNGILAIYIAGIIVGNKQFVRKASIIQFYAGFTWLMQIVMFLVLGLLVFPSEIPEVVHIGFGVAMFLMFVARPVAVFITLSASRLNFKDKLLIAWGGLRGASPIIFATFPMVAGIESSSYIFHLVFFVSLTSVLLQGSTLTWVAGKLRLLAKSKVANTIPLELSTGTNTTLEEMKVGELSHIIGMNIGSIDIHPRVLLALIERDGDNFIPKGGTIIKNGDILVVISDDENKIAKFKNYINITKDVNKDNQ